VQLDPNLAGQLTLALGPELLMMGGAMVVMLWAAWRPESDEHQRRIGNASLVLTLLTAALVIGYAVRGVTASSGIIAVDNFRWASDLIFLLATAIVLPLAMDYNSREQITAPEAHVLVLFATSGMMLLAAARDLMIVFLGIELMSIAVYVLAGINRRSARSAEGALKYFLLGAFSTGFLLYGIALIYGATGTTNLQTIGERIAELGLAGSPMLVVGVGLLLVGFAFKIAAAPFHMWAPDVYEGAPTPITGYMAAAVKAAAFAAMLRIWLEAFPSVFGHWHLAVWWLAAVTMIVGNLVALAQKNIKRLLAYSSIGHTGFVLVALATNTAAGSSAFLFYLFAYTLATMGAFAVIVALTRPGQEDRVDALSGLWNERPGLAVAMSVFMLALLGFPVFGGMGFLAKWYVLQAALQAPTPQTHLAVLLVIATMISAGYYLYVVMVMFMRPRPDDAVTPAPASGLTRFVIAGAAVLIVVFGVFPDSVLRLTRSSAAPTPPTAAAQLPPSAGGR
jgi:NADH-quinone oxidoreductase subunit N